MVVKYLAPLIFVMLLIPDQPVSAEKLDAQCECIDGGFSRAGNSALLRHRVGGDEYIVCGYERTPRRIFEVDERPPGTAVYVSGYDILDCSADPVQSIYMRGEYYTERVFLEPESIVIQRLDELPLPYMDVLPLDEEFEFSTVPVFATELYEHEGRLESRVSVVFPVDQVTDEFLNAIHERVVKEKHTGPSYRYHEWLMSYHFIKAMINPEQYGDELRAIGDQHKGFDSYLGVIYRNLLEYYELNK